MTSNASSPAMFDVLLAETGLQALEDVLPVVVVLVQDADLGIGAVARDRLPVDPSLELVRRLPADRPRVPRRVRAEDRGAGRIEHLRHLARVEVRPHGEVHLGAERPDDGEDLVLLDELARELHAVGRVVPVVVEVEDDLAAADAALAVRPLAGVDPREVRLHGDGDRRVQRRRPGERERAADGDRLRGDAGLGRPRRRARCHDPEHRYQRRCREHDFLHAGSFEIERL